MDALKRRSGCQKLVGGAGTMGYSRTHTEILKEFDFILGVFSSCFCSSFFVMFLFVACPSIQINNFFVTPASQTLFV